MVLMNDGGRISIVALTLDEAAHSARELERFCALVARLWPQNGLLHKADLDAWLKDLAPSPGLMEWFSRAPEECERFYDRYFRELEMKPKQCRDLLDVVRREPVTLVCGSALHELNTARALRDFLQKKLSGMPVLHAA